MEKIPVSYAFISADVNVKLIEETISAAKKGKRSSIVSASFWSKKIVRELKGSAVKHTCWVGYPFGQQLTEAKIFEAEKAIEMGAKEIILSINTSAVKSESLEWVKIEIARFANFLHKQEKFLGIFIDHNFFSETEIEKILKACQSAGADYVLLTYNISFIKQAYKQLGETLGIKVLCEEANQEEVLNNYLFIEEILVRK